MTKGALYRHYKSKRDIFDSIVKRMEQQDSEQARENEVPEESIEKTPEEYQNVSFDDFVEYSKSMFEYWTEDDFASSFRKMRRTWLSACSGSDSDRDRPGKELSG